MAPDWEKMTLGGVARAIHGALGEVHASRRVIGVGLDSRRDLAGRLFWALKGERFDGHDFVRQVLEKGAGGAVVAAGWLAREGRAAEWPCIGVADTLAALGELARWWRAGHAVRTVALTGSVGKTTTKEMIAAILGLAGPTLKNTGNQNNLIGLPLTLLQLTAGHRFAVVELGMNHFGEIERLTAIAQPDVGLITNVGAAHLEGVGDLEGVAQAKTELVACLPPGAAMVVNGDDARLLRHARRWRSDLITYGRGATNDFRAERLENRGMGGLVFDIVDRDGAWPVRLNSPGEHQVANALAAAAVARCLEVSWEIIRRGLAAYAGVPGRFTVHRLANGALLVDDTYNANPASLAAGLAALAALRAPGAQLLVGLGDMLELGAASGEAHREAGAGVAAAGADLFVALGTHAPDMQAGAVAGGMGNAQALRAESREEMRVRLKAAARPGDVIYLKGSRRVGLDQVVKQLTAEQE